MLQYEWASLTLRTEEDIKSLIQLIKTVKPVIGAFDTETTGLHLTQDVPFLYQFGFLDTINHKGYTFAVDLEKLPNFGKRVINLWHSYAKKLKLYYGHNIKFDLHMLDNINVPYNYPNVADTQHLIRYSHDALKPDKGGPPLALKDYTARYITPSAKLHEHKVKKERSMIAKGLNQKLIQRFKTCGTPPAKYNARSYTAAVIKEIFNDCTFEVDDLPENLKVQYKDWLHTEVPLCIQPYINGLVLADDIPYTLVDRNTLIEYGHKDIVYTLEIHLHLYKTLIARGNEESFIRENKLILPFYRMERTGFKADKDYLLEAKSKLKNYIRQKRKELADLVEQNVSIGQHALIKKILNERYEIAVDSTSNETLKKTASDLKISDPNNPVIKVIELIEQLRTLEKWYSVYIIRFIHNLQRTDYMYTQINQVGTISGRVTSDFQQFPKDAIKDDEGNELFHPRKVVLAKDKNCDGIVYLDYSQIELRFQAMYTILVGNPDTNLCRAYMPYKCINKQGELFDYTNYEHIKHWKDEWYYEENPKEHWVATDVHGATTKAAFGIDENHPDFHSLRYIGKRVNFAKNYGAQYNKIRSMFPERTAEECRRIDDAYYKAFPGVKQYHEYCYKRAQLYSYTENMFGLKYYGVSGHNLKNMLVQGSAAIFLKEKIIAIDEYIIKNNLKSRIQMQIHDELSFLKAPGEEEHFKNIKHIMEDWEDGMIPIVADMEYTTTRWADKYEVSSVEELK